MLGAVIASRITRMSSVASQTVIEGESTQAGSAQAGAARIMDSFESLGDTCEFGFAQRHFGIEPIGLLRWTGAPLPGLLDALGARFAGLYRREDLVVIDGGSVLDRKYDLRFHAGPYTNDGLSGQRPVDWTEVALPAHAREQRHVGFLLRTTLADDWGDAAAIPPEPGGDGEMAARALAFEPTETGAMVYEPVLAKALATAIYHVLLLRRPDDGGLRALAGSLSAGQRSMEEAMISALESPEFAALAPRFVARYTRK